MDAAAAGSRALPAVALATIYIVWGSTYVGIALAIETLPPFLMAGVRFVVAGAILYAVARRIGPPAPRPGARQWGAALLTGTLLLGIGNGGVVWAEQTVPTGVCALVIASIPLWIVVLDRLCFGARLTWPAGVGAAVGFAGVAILVTPGGTGAVDLAGGVALLAAAVCWAVGTLLSRGETLTVPPLVGGGMQMLAGGAGLLVAGAATGELGRLDLGQVSGRSLVGLAYLVVFGSLLAFSAYVWLLRNTRTSLVATYAYVNPVVAVALGWWMFGEAIGVRVLLAGGVIVAAVALIVSAAPVQEREARSRSTGRALPRTAGRLRAAVATRGR